MTHAIGIGHNANGGKAAFANSRKQLPPPHKAAMAVPNDLPNPNWPATHRAEYARPNVQQLIGGPLPTIIRERVHEIASTKLGPWGTNLIQAMLQPRHRTGFDSSCFMEARCEEDWLYPSFSTIAAASQWSPEEHALRLARNSIVGDDQGVLTAGPELTKHQRAAFVNGLAALINAFLNMAHDALSTPTPSALNAVDHTELKMKYYKRLWPAVCLQACKSIDQWRIKADCH